MRLGKHGLWLLTIAAAGFIGSAAHQWLCAGGARALAAEGPGVAGEVRATRFVLVDAGGNVRAVLGDFQWAPGKEAAVPDWQAAAPATGLVVYDKGGKPHVQLGTTDKGCYLDMRHLVGRATYGVTDAAVGMRFYCPEPAMRLGLGMARAGNGGMAWMDRRGRQRFAIGMPAHAGVSINLLDENGETVWCAP